MIWALAVMGATVLLMAAAAAVGAALPLRHVARRTARFKPPPEAVWAVLTDHAAEPTWRRALRSVQRQEDHEGRPVWREVDRRGRGMSLETLEAVAPSRLVRRIVDTGLPFSGRWTIEIAPDGLGSRVSIVEEGEVKHPLLRFVSRFFLGYAATIDAYLKALGKRFGEAVVIE